MARKHIAAREALPTHAREWADVGVALGAFVLGAWLWLAFDTGADGLCGGTWTNMLALFAFSPPTEDEKVASASAAAA